MSDYGSTPPPPPPPPGGQNPYGAPPPPSDAGYGAPQGYNAPPPPAGGLAPQGGSDLASWGQRAGGYLIDLLLLVPGYILYFIGAPKPSMDATTGVTTTTGGSGALIALGGLYMLGVTIWNRWLKGGNTGQTIGRGVVGVKVVDANTGQPVGPLKAFLRDLAHFVDSIICYVGWLFPLWDAKKQTIADKIMSTVAIRVAK